MKPLLLVFCLLLCLAAGIQDIMHFGAVPNSDTLSAQLANQKAISQAIAAANASASTGDQRIVVIPYKKFYSLPFNLNYVSNLVLEVRGKLLACNRIKNYPKHQNKISYTDFIGVSYTTNMTIRGGGTIDGRGYIWWLNSWLVTKKYMPPHTGRPHLIAGTFNRNLTVNDLRLKNSPSFHLVVSQTVGAKFYNLDIKVNTTAQLDILKRNYLTGIVPMFPLNTDGIDPSGSDFHIYNITCQNYDDVVVPKPTHSSSDSFTNCTQNMLIENISVRLGVGLSIGSVPPNAQHNCIQNITFRHSHMQRPFKGIYIKTNPGNTGSGVIQDILYQNITMYKPIWWAVYLGPQQQKQPDKGGPGCMLYPFDPKGTCATQPRIDIRNITLKDIVINRSWLFPVVLRCNQSNPCQSVNIDNLQARRWLIGKKDKGYVCENIELTINNTYPPIQCTKTPRQLRQVEEQQEEIDRLSVRSILQKMQQAHDQVPYVDQDDQMFLDAQAIKEDSAAFASTLMIETI